MAKTKSVFVCSSCGGTAPKWAGRCPACGEWDTMSEEAVREEGPRASRAAVGTERPCPVTAIEADQSARSDTGDHEINRILGGGLVPGSAVLVGGDPGIGKSTLLLQLAGSVAASGTGPVLYVSAEESARQVRLRAERLGLLHDALYVYAENNVDLILKEAESLNPALIVIDSIQMVFWPLIESAPGSVSQVRESAAGLIALAKRLHAPMFLVGHVTMVGAIAGPKVLEHMVDVVLYFEGDRHHAARILRAVKNRFGAVNEIGVFEMAARGLRAVEDPSRLFLSSGAPNEGSVITASLEGTRPFLVEVQALAVAGAPGNARRRVTGADAARVSMLLAVLEKRCGLPFFDQDVFVNVVGGAQLNEPCSDLAMALAMAGSLQERPLRNDMVVLGEVGLGGELRAVHAVETRLKEAARLGFKSAIIPSGNVREAPGCGLELFHAAQLDDALQFLGDRRGK